jgi:hypothetical protein
MPTAQYAPRFAEYGKRETCDALESILCIESDPRPEPRRDYRFQSASDAAVDDPERLLPSLADARRDECRDSRRRIRQEISKQPDQPLIMGQELAGLGGRALVLPLWETHVGRKA